MIGILSRSGLARATLIHPPFTCYSGTTSHLLNVTKSTTASTMQEWLWLVGMEMCTTDGCNDTKASSVDASKQDLHFKSIQMRRIISLRQSQEENNKLPGLVLRRMLASAITIVCTYMNDFLFLSACAVAVGFLFPTIDDTILQEIEQARKELGVDLLQASLNHYQTVSRIQKMGGL
jgi:hypothetical protein